MDAPEARHEMPGDARDRRRLRRLTLALGLPLIAAAAVATLSQTVERRVGTNALPAKLVFATPQAGHAICQTGERIPAGTAALRFPLVASSDAAPRLAVTLTDGDAPVAHGTRTRWDGSGSVLVQLARPVPHDVAGTTCLRLRRGGPPQYALEGVPTDPAEGATEDGQPLQGRMHVEYLAAGRTSWWALLPTLVRRIGRGHAWSGASVALLAALLMLTPIALGAWQLSRDRP